MIRLIFFVLFILSFTSGEAIHRKMGFIGKREFQNSPAPFEKIYVDEGKIISTPSGTFVKQYDGTLERVRAVLYDTRGMYVLRIQTQCPQCGRCYDGKTPPADYSCPLYEKEIFPGYWAPP